MKKLYLVGLGPGAREYRTVQAERVLSECETLCGYGPYLDLIPEFHAGKKILQTPMTKETERCRMALSAAEEGETTALVCSGDAEIYGLAGLAFQLAEQYPGVELEVVPGLTAAVSGGALLGSPLTNDFAVISLSDLLTPWETIEQRLKGAGTGGFVICLYNPGSKTRKDHLRRACEILEPYRSPETVCGVVREIGREGQAVRLLPFSELKDYEPDMVTTVFIGNSETRNIGGRMVNPRGYERKKSNNVE